jgi:hypothetical protein
MLAAAAVHTTGVDWTSIAVIAGVVTGIIGGFTKWILNSLKAERKEQSESIMAQVRLITDALERRLSAVDNHLDRQDVTQERQGRDIAHIQGMMTMRSKDDGGDT